jgi:hypothetical protein
MNTPHLPVLRLSLTYASPGLFEVKDHRKEEGLAARTGSLDGRNQGGVGKKETGRGRPPAFR